MELLYRSTRNHETAVTASRAILQGLAEDGGLFVPDAIPKLGISLDKLAGMTYQETAYEVMKLFLTDFTEEELKSRCAGFPHDGCVIASGVTGAGNGAVVEYHCRWGSNPDAPANILVAHARAVGRLASEGRSGAFTILDIPASYFSRHSREDLLKKFM